MKKPLSATVDASLVSWIDKKLKGSPRFRNRSHLVETALRKFIDDYQEES